MVFIIIIQESSTISILIKSKFFLTKTLKLIKIQNLPHVPDNLANFYAHDPVHLGGG